MLNRISGMFQRVSRGCHGRCSRGTTEGSGAFHGVLGTFQDVSVGFRFQKRSRGYQEVSGAFREFQRSSRKFQVISEDFSYVPLG